VIFQKFEFAKKLIFIIQGEVQIYLNDTDIQTYSKGQVIGEREFVSRGRYDYSARAIQYAELAILE
jgi:CRP-like cAMP-binding protein